MRRQVLDAGTVALIAFFIIVPRSNAASVSIPASRDNTIFSAQPNNSNGLGPDFFAGVSGTPSNIRGLVYFNLVGQVPPGATINSASLAMVVSGGATNGPATVAAAVHRLTSNWGEGTSNAGTSPMSGNGTAATPGDATWQQNVFGTSSWLTSGGDFLASPSATASSIPLTLGAGVTWTGLSADVQFWLNSPSSNFGWIVVGDESQLRTVRRFHSHEATVEANRPMLTIDFTPVPEPSSIWLAIFTMGALSIARAKRNHF